MAKTKVLVADDDHNICELLRLYLEKDGYDVSSRFNGEDTIKAFNEESYDLILLDIMMPKGDGWHVLREVRKTSKIPVIMITAKGETFDKLTGFELGADDYVVKPFDAKEVLARIKAVLKRTNPDKVLEVKELSYDNLTINLTSYIVKLNDKIVEMPPKELELLFHLANNPNKVYTRDQLLDEVWDFEYFGDSRTVDVHVRRLREKIEGASDKWSLKTVWGVGYKFEVVN